MTNDMRKRGAAATNGTTAEPVKTDAPHAAPDAKTVTIECTGGHFGISCANHEMEPLGVLLTFCDTHDLAYKAGLREGDVVTAVNGVPVSAHGAFIEAINKAADATPKSPEANLRVEYLVSGVPPARLAGG